MYRLHEGDEPLGFEISTTGGTIKAEANSLDAARLAARVLLEEGEGREFNIYAPDGSCVSTARFNAHGEVEYVESTLTRRYENGPALGLQC